MFAGLGGQVGAPRGLAQPSLLPGRTLAATHGPLPVFAMKPHNFERSSKPETFDAFTPKFYQPASPGPF